MQSPSEHDEQGAGPDPPQCDPARPPESGVDWRVFVGVGIAVAGFIIALLMAALG